MRSIFVFVFSIALFLNYTESWACATCLCGDPTITTMGTEKPFAGRMRVGVEVLSRGEKGGVPGISEFETDEDRITYSFSYALNSEWMFAVSVPFATKTVKRLDMSNAQGSGIGDTDFSARWFIGKDDHFPSRYLWGIQLGVRVATSSEQTLDGELIDIDAQPGGGATIPSIGAWYGRYALPWFFYVSTTYQHAVTTGYQGYMAGDAILVTGLMQYALDNGLALQFSLDSRYKQYDEYYHVRDENSGGALIMATPGIAWTPVEDWVVNLSYQMPAIENSNGEQEEFPIFRLGVAYDF